VVSGGEGFVSAVQHCRRVCDRVEGAESAGGGVGRRAGDVGGKCTTICSVISTITVTRHTQSLGRMYMTMTSLVIVALNLNFLKH
jgi:hypothetical protein